MTGANGPERCTCGRYATAGGCVSCPSGQYQPGDDHVETACINASGLRVGPDKCFLINSSVPSSTSIRTTCGVDQYYNVANDTCQSCPQDKVRNLPAGVTEHNYTSCVGRDCNSCADNQWCELYNNSATCREITDCEVNVCNDVNCNVCVTTEATNVTDTVCGPCDCTQLMEAWNSTRKPGIKNKFNSDRCAAC